MPSLVRRGARIIFAWCSLRLRIPPSSGQYGEGSRIVFPPPPDWWLAHGPDICRRHPVREVVITGGWVQEVPATPWVPQRYVSQLSRIGTPEIISSVLSDIAYGRPRTTENEVRGEVSAAYLKWAEAEADTTPGG